MPRSCASVVFATAQPWCSAADEVVVGHEHLVEEDLVELGVAGDLHERADLDARRLHVDDEVRDAPVLRRVGIGAGEADAPPRRTARSEVHTFWPESSQPSSTRTARVWSDARSEPASGSLNSWHQISSAVRMAGSHRCLLLVGAVGEQRRAGEVDADPVDRLRARATARTPC